MLSTQSSSRVLISSLHADRQTVAVCVRNTSVRLVRAIITSQSGPQAAAAVCEAVCREWQHGVHRVNVARVTVAERWVMAARWTLRRDRVGGHDGYRSSVDHTACLGRWRGPFRQCRTYDELFVVRWIPPQLSTTTLHPRATRRRRRESLPHW